MTKQTWIIILLVVAAIGGYLWYTQKKTPTLSTTGNNADEFETEDTAAYNSVLSLLTDIDAGAVSWVNDIVAKRYKSNPYKINGRPSKTATFVELITQINPNESGKHTNPGTGKKELWPNEMVVQMFEKFYNPLKAKYSAL